MHDVHERPELGGMLDDAIEMPVEPVGHLRAGEVRSAMRCTSNPRALSAPATWTRPNARSRMKTGFDGSGRERRGPDGTDCFLDLVRWDAKIEGDRL